MRLALVAGEASGDLLAALMLQGLKQTWPGLTSGGIGGPRMVQQGLEAWAPSERLSVFGYVDAIKRLPELLWLRHRTQKRILRERPDVFVGVDAPDFNFGLETALRQRGVRTVHFVCPSIWAWRPERVQRLRAAADHVLCLFPFEPALLASHGVAATYVGHPLADAIDLHVDRGAARQSLGLDGRLAAQAPHSVDAPRFGPSSVVALLPGSRRAEIRHIAPLLVASAQEMLRQRSDLRFVLPVAPGLEDLLTPIVQPLVEGGHLTLLAGRAHEAMACADVALVASGTATLEAALLKCPQVIVYRLAPADWHRMRRMRLQPWVGLPNILSREFIVPERIQDEARPELVAGDALRWLDDAAAVDRYRARCLEMHQQLRQNTGARAAQALKEVVGE
ncbi:MAG: lipid-A-disaccharide synthase [Betaproteobacteria bacterium]|nr:lipid-A-disaccharide synthase [Betaproteobacteria bacterium]NBT09764.1 lipid-A-disaccharide synthase [Betaproteobacteria bacterium]NBU49265.1 lipid-A-disaccharide synthase [Betaproteobacteria bacterium]